MSNSKSHKNTARKSFAHTTTTTTETLRSGTTARAEFSALLDEVLRQIDRSPQKAAIVLTEWMDRAANASKENAAHKKKAA